MLAPSPPGLHQQDDGARLIRGQLVEVKSAQEIAATLDADGMLDGTPFMPEMARYCGQRLRVLHRADITCVEGLGLRRMTAAVFLEGVRCDGSAHDGCQRRCLVFWKEAWLRPIGIAADDAGAAPDRAAGAALVATLPTRRDARFLCQSTVLARATVDLPAWNLLPFIRQVHDGELNVIRFVVIFGLALLNRVRKLFGRPDFGSLSGVKSNSVQQSLMLSPGDWVRIKSHADIASTLDAHGRNRGLLFEPEMAEQIGRCFQVDFILDSMIHEQTGKMIHPTRTVALREVTCGGLCAKGCARGNYWFWREDWLERISSATRG
jgi:hypothetical protein